MRRAVSLVSLALTGASLAACESFPQIQFAVRDAQNAPVANAVILLPTDGYTGDSAALAASLRDDVRLTQHMRRQIGTDADADGAFAMRTGPEGDATYTELRFRFWFVPPGTVERRFLVWADGFEPRTITVQVGVTDSRIDVPLERIR